MKIGEGPTPRKPSRFQGDSRRRHLSCAPEPPLQFGSEEVSSLSDLAVVIARASRDASLLHSIRVNGAWTFTTWIRRAYREFELADKLESYETTTQVSVAIEAFIQGKPIPGTLWDLLDAGLAG